MYQNGPAGQNRDQPALPSYAEAIRTAPPPTNLDYSHNVNVEESYQPSAPVFSTTTQSMPSPYIGQSSYNPTTISPPTVGNYPSTYATNAYPLYGPNSGNSGAGPATIHIIRPVSTRSKCCSGRTGPILATILSIIIIGAIIRVTMNSYF